MDHAGDGSDDEEEGDEGNHDGNGEGSHRRPFRSRRVKTIPRDDRTAGPAEPAYGKRFAPGPSARDYMRIPASRVLLAALVVVALAVATGGVAGGEDPSVRSFEADTATADTPPESIGVENGISASENGVSASESEVSASGSEFVGTGDRITQVDTGSELASETRIRIDLQPDRDARWEIIVRYRFTDANRTAAFETVGERFVDGEVGPDPALFEGFAARAGRTVDREMGIVEVDREVVVTDDPAGADVETDDEVVAVGELRLTFVWTAFLAEDGEDLVLGDAFTTPDGGTWLRSLEADQTIEVATPDGYTVSGTPGATVPLRENAVVIEGPRAFEGEERVAVVYSPTATERDVPWTLLAGSIVVSALLIAVGLVGYRRRHPDDGDAGAAASATDVGSGPGDEAAGTTVTGESDLDGGKTGAGAHDGPNEDPDDGTEEDLSLLSDEERVERLLERNGGRMRQADIVDETGWSDAKVSQLLSAMADEDRVEKLRLGRENLISLPDDDGFGPDTDDGAGPNGGSGSNGGTDPDGGSDPDDSGGSDRRRGV